MMCWLLAFANRKIPESHKVTLGYTWEESGEQWHLISLTAHGPVKQC